MNDYHERLTKILLEKNDHITYEQALTWVELLWEDFETTYAKAGHEYAGEEMTSRVVRTWIDNYGERFHEFIAKNPKYKHLLDQQNHLH
ncbi:YfhJ family protein [Peribacillus sp. NPDC097295]|uniref:YfhJ family protein n=1 Tax=Peribacillus sp. NPDC097295 TaxID=3364402 RepID=UPI0037FC1D23